MPRRHNLSIPKCSFGAIRFESKAICALVAFVLALSTTSALSFDDLKPQTYEPPTLPQCSTSAPTVFSNVGDCLSFDGMVSFGIGYSSADGVASGITTGLGTTFVAGASDARIVGRIKLELPPAAWGVDTNGNLVWLQKDISIAESYIAAGSDGAFFQAGKVTKSIVNTSDDKPFNYLGLLGTFGNDPLPDDDNPDDGVLWPRIFLAGRSIQGVWKPSDTILLATGAEALDQNGTLTGVVSYNDNVTSAHLSIVQGGFLSGNTRSAFHTGATTSLGAWRFRAAIAGDDTGFLHAMSSGEMFMGIFKLALSGDILRNRLGYNDWIGFGGSISVEVTDALVAEVGGVTHCAGSSCSPSNMTTQIGARLTLQLMEDLKFRVAGGGYKMGANLGFLSEPVTYLTSELEWSPSPSLEGSLKYEANSLGAYKFVFNAKKQFGLPIN